MPLRFSQTRSPRTASDAQLLVDKGGLKILGLSQSQRIRVRSESMPTKLAICATKSRQSAAGGQRIGSRHSKDCYDDAMCLRSQANIKLNERRAARKFENELPSVTHQQSTAFAFRSLSRFATLKIASRITDERCGRFARSASVKAPRFTVWLFRVS